MNPKLRFKQCDGSDFPDWQSCQLKSLIGYERPEKYIVKDEILEVGKTPVLTANKSFILGFTDEEDNIYSNGEAIVFDDFTCDFKYVDFSFKLKSSAIKILTPNTQGLARFFAGALEHLNPKPEGHQRHWISQTQNIHIFCPCNEEQKRIGSLFSLLDDKIQVEEKKARSHKLLKRRLLIDILSQKRKVPSSQKLINSEWSTATINEVATICGGGTPSTFTPSYWNGDIQWLTPTEINSKFVHKSKRSITEAGLNNSSAKLLPLGTILLTTRATLGACSINNFNGPVCTNQGFQSLIPNNTIVGEYLYYVIQSPDFQKEMKRKSSGSTFLEISPSNLKEIRIPLPSLEEQKIIADFFSLLDTKIELIEKRIETTKQLKQVLLQQMFV